MIVLTRSYHIAGKEHLIANGYGVRAFCIIILLLCNHPFRWRQIACRESNKYLTILHPLCPEINMLHWPVIIHTPPIFSSMTKDVTKAAITAEIVSSECFDLFSCLIVIYVVHIMYLLKNLVGCHDGCTDHWVRPSLGHILLLVKRGHGKFLLLRY